MHYVSAAQLAERPGAAELAQVATAEHLPLVEPELLDATLRGADRSAWTPEEQAAADAVLARIDEIASKVDQTIDRYLAKRLTDLPVTPAPGSLCEIAQAIVRYRVHKDVADDRSAIVRDYRDAMRELKEISDGDRPYGPGDPVASGRAEGLIHTSSRERIFTRGTLDGL